MQNLKKIYRILTYSWVWNLANIAQQRPLNIADIPVLEEGVNASSEEHATRKLSLQNPFKLFISLMTPHQILLITIIISMLLRLFVSLVSPVVLGLFVREISRTGLHSITESLVILGLALAALNIVQGFVVGFYFSHLDQLTLRVQNTVVHQLLHKCLVVNHEQRSHWTIGNFINSVTNDASNLAAVSFTSIEFLHDLILMTIGTGLLFHYLGISALISVLLLAFLSPLSKRISASFEAVDDAVFTMRDKRITLIHRVITSIRQLKSLALEKSALKEMDRLRNEEVSVLKKHIVLGVQSAFLYGGARVLIPLITFSCYVLFNNAFVPEILFASLVIIAMLESPFGDITGYLAEFSRAKVSGLRIIELLKARTNQMEPATGKAVKNHSSEMASIVLSNLSLYTSEAQPILKSINLVFEAGKSYAIVGPIGAGKTSLLLTMLGELNSFKGTLTYANSNAVLKDKPKMAWVPQEPALLNDSLLHNLSLGEKCDIQSDILEDCALIEDINALPEGIHTIVGNHGVNLSGGQKQRVALAQAAYLKSNIILLDDPFSAVDPKVEDHLMDKLIFMRWKKCMRVIATHRLRNLEKFDQIIFLEEGEVKGVGSLDTLLSTNPRFIEFYQKASTLSQAMKQPTSITDPILEDEVSKIEEKYSILPEGAPLSEEYRHHGKVKFKTWASYIKMLASGKDNQYKWGILCLLILSMFCTAALPLLQDFWLSRWISVSDILPLHHVDLDMWKNLLIYVAIGFSALGFIPFNHWLWAKQCLKTSAMLYAEIWSALMSVSVKFFDQTPHGRIISRLSKDIETIDMELPDYLRRFVLLVFKLMLTFFIIISSIWQSLVVIPFIMLLAFKMGKLRNVLSRELHRLEATSRSIFLNHIQQTFENANLFRAALMTSARNKKMLFFFDILQQGNYALSIMRWGFYIVSQILVGILIGIVAIASIYMVSKGLLNPVIAGLLLKFSLDLSREVLQLAEAFGKVETEITAFERLEEWRHLPLEQSNITTRNDAICPSDWPTKGHIEISSISARYDHDLPLVLHSVSLKIKPGQKVGIIGRTGAGKSSMLQCLLGFLDLVEGSIKIDGIDIHTIPLSILRRNITIILQNPKLLIGTFRDQLDPHLRYSDSEIWKILDLLELATLAESFSDKLSAPISQFAKKLSVGQKQLLSLGRAILAKPSVLLLDEATSNMDVETDHRIQVILRTECKHMTIISVAHRIETLSGYDAIYEVSAGRLNKVENGNLKGRSLSSSKLSSL